MKLFTAWLVILIIVIACTEPQDLTPYKSGDLYVPGDLQVTLWAESPLLNNPTNMDVDIKGRIWITEAVNYRNYRNTDSTFLHRQTGDRIVILEDTNDDGRADLSKVFVQDSDLVAPLGIAVLGDKIVVSCAPNLIVYTDANGDDVPDSKEILLTGFGGKDHDHSLHAVYGGADGNWYFNTGNAGPHIVKDNSGFTLRSGSMYTGGSPYNNENEGRMKSDDGKVWTGGLALRINNDGGGLKVMAHNFRNSYEIIPDSYGNLWQNDNDDEVVSCRASWLMEGGNAGFFSADGTRSWKADQRPGQTIPVAHWHQDDPGVMPVGDITGAGAPTGVSVIEGAELGERFRGMFLTADAGRNIIFGYHPQIDRSGYDLGERENFISSIDNSNENYVWNDSALMHQRDKWFRPSDVTVGTDGAIYVADWYDAVVGGHMMQDSAAYGRIYRVSRKDKKMNKPVYDPTTLQGQIDVLKSPAINVRFSAFQKIVARGTEAVAPVKQLLNDENPYVQARSVWLLGKIDTSEVTKLLNDERELIRVTALRALRQNIADIMPYALQLAGDRSPFVRREVAVAVRDLPYDSTKKKVLISLVKNYDGGDKWYCETLASALKGHEEEIYPEIKSALQQEHPASWTEKMSSIAFSLHPASSAKDFDIRARAQALSIKERIRAVTALGFIEDSSALAFIRALSKSTVPEIAEQANFWLSMRSPASVSHSSPIGEAMYKLKNIAGDKQYAIANVLKLQGDSTAGSKIFAAYCATCHRVKDQGKTIGPDLTHIGGKFDNEQLLRAIIFPDEAVQFGYVPTLITKKDQLFVYGFVVSDSKETLMVRDIGGQNITVNKADIVKSERLASSIMPSAAQFNFTEQDLRNILQFLQN